MSDRITLTGLAVMARHGVLDFEKQIPQPFVLDIAIEADLRAAGESDDLDASLSYAEVAARAIEVCSGEPVDLIETLAERVAEACLEWPIVEAVDVTVHKPQAPAGVPFTPTTGVMAGASVSVRRERRRTAVIALGTNLGRRVATMRSARVALSRLDGFEVQHVSPLVETDPVGGVAQPDYLNAVIVGRTRLAPAHLIRELHRIEREHGRVRDVRWGARTLDLDLIALGDAGEADEVLVGRAAGHEGSDEGANRSAAAFVDGDRAASGGLSAAHSGGPEVGDGPGRVEAGAASASESPLALPHPRAHERAFVLVPWAQATPWAKMRTPAGVRPVLDVLAELDSSGVRPGPFWRTPEYLDLDALSAETESAEIPVGDSTNAGVTTSEGEPR